MELNTKAHNTWCPGCSNFGILTAFKGAVNALCARRGVLAENIVIATGVGCHGKITDYLNLNSFTALHGRALPILMGAKIGNPQLKTVAFVGDGDAYAEGLDHLIHAAKKNTDITVIVHNNGVFALTAGQSSPLSPKGIKTKFSPESNENEPLNALGLLFAAGASFLARTYAYDTKRSQEIFFAAMRHKGFSLVEVIQPCITFYDTRADYQKKIYWLEGKNKGDNVSVILTKKESKKGKIPLGIFYQTNRPSI